MSTQGRRMSNKDKFKLAYAYVIAPLFLVIMIIKRMSVRAPNIFGENEFIAVLAVSTAAGYLPFIAAPTILRFAILRRRLRYGVELYLYLLLCFILTHISYFVILGIKNVRIGDISGDVIYCILSFGAADYGKITRSYRRLLNVATFIGFCVVCFISQITNFITPFSASKEFFLLFWALNRHARQAEQPTLPQEPLTAQSVPSTHPVPSTQPDRVSRLLDIGLAHIGRKTQTENPYITPELADERRTIERPFLTLLAERYKDERAQKTIAHYFAVYKEMTLFVIYELVLGNDSKLYAQVRTKLRERLLSGLTPQNINKHKTYWTDLSDKFHENYGTAQDIGITLAHTFWSAIKPNITVGADNLADIFEYTRKAIEQEYQTQKESEYHA